jgi:hypothetical protein
MSPPKLKTVLIGDLDELVQEEIGLALGSEYRVRTLQAGEAVPEILSRELPDYLILDSERDGFTVRKCSGV